MAKEIIDNMPTLVTNPDGTKSWVYNTLEETGHASMQDRAKAAQRMVTALTDSWEVWLTNPTKPPSPKWFDPHDEKTKNFIRNMVAKFDLHKLENVEITKQQYWWLKDLYDKYLELGG